MEKMKVIYGVNYLPGSILVSLFTWSRWSHCGIVSSCGEYVYESTAFGGVTKTAFKRFKHQYRKIFIGEMPAEHGWEDRAESLIGRKYDWFAILGIVFRQGKWNSKNRWFCSELVAYASGVFRCNRYARITPEHCYKISKDVSEGKYD